jgi:predicted PurR-regulated permease PerM
MTEQNIDPGMARPVTPHSIFRRRLWLTITSVTAVVLIVLLALSAIDVLFLLFLGILLAVLLNGLASTLRDRTRLSYGLSLAIVGLVIVVLIVLFALVLGSTVAQQIDQFSQQIPQSIEELEALLEEYSWGRTLLDQIPDNIEFTGFLTSGTTFLTRATGIVSSTLGTLANLFIVLFVGIYLAIEPQTYVENGLRLLPVDRRPRAREILSAMRDILLRWLFARFLSMTVVGVLTTVGLTLIGMPVALTLGLIAGILSFVPNIGPLLAIVPAALVALGGGVQQVLVVILLYSAVQAVESYLITPFVERRTVELPPAITLIMQLFLSIVVGFLGLLLAAPLVAVIIVLVRMLYIEDVLGEGHSERVQT